MKHIFNPRQQDLLVDLCEKYTTTPIDNILRLGTVYLEKLIYYNRTVPLISRAGDQQDRAIQLFLTSMEALAYLPEKYGLLALDIGTGGGFPAFPLKIARPDIRWVLLESRERKCTVLEALIALLGFSNMKVVNRRFEAYLPASASEIEIVVSRAGPSPVDILPWARGLSGLRQVLVFESSAKQDLSRFDGLESDLYLLRKKEIGTSYEIESLWLLSFEKRGE